MVMQKWEIRYSLLLLLFFSSRTSPFPSVSLEKNCTVCDKECALSQIRQLATDSDQSCQRCACLIADDLKFLEIFRMTHPANVPFIFSSPALTPVGQTVQLSCMVWCSTDVCHKNVSKTKMSLESNRPLQETQQKQYIVLGESLKLSIHNLTITVDSGNSRDVLNCFVHLDKADVAKRVLFAYDMADPVLAGPEEVSPISEYKWDCLVDFVVLIDNLKVKSHLDFEVELLDAEDLNITNEGPFINPVSRNGQEGLQVSKRMIFTIPKGLQRNSFSVLCTIIHRELNVTKTAGPLLVSVLKTGQTAMYNGRKLLIGGVVLVSFAVLNIFVLAVLLVWTRRQQQSISPEVIALDLFGIEERHAPDKVAYKSYYRASREIEPESSILESSIVVDESISDSENSLTLPVAPPCTTTPDTTITTSTPSVNPTSSTTKAHPAPTANLTTTTAMDSTDL